MLTRRNFLKLTSMGIGTAVVSTGLVSCSDSDDGNSVAFNEGVASGDPLSDALIIWTRATPETDTPVTVQWEVAIDEQFLELTHTGQTVVTNERDYTVKVDVRNLQAGTRYYYRFSANGTSSAIGSGKTLPVGDVSEVKLAVVSCSNYPAGFFHVYAEAAKIDDLDAVLHLGDYLYEYGNGGYATEDAESLGRELASDNNLETITLEDYRKRYALYRSDIDLQNLHATTAFIAVWDDHEVTNDTWREGAENHNNGEGDFLLRRQRALQAYFEWMPIRPASEDDELTIYRRFDFGNLASLYMLDTRLIGRDEQLDTDAFTDADSGSFDAAGFQAAITDTNRTLLGEDQFNWLTSNMSESTTTWQVLGQQVLMGRMLIPAELPANLASLPALVSLKVRALNNDPTLTPEELARINTTVPYNLDAWDGYFAERERLFTLAMQQDKNLVVLAGDTHNAWANNLRAMDGTSVGVEFATPSVSSPGLEDLFVLENVSAAATVEGALSTLIDDLQYLNVLQRGFSVVTLTPQDAKCDWVFVDTIKSANYSVDEDRAAQRTTLPGPGNRTLS